MEKVKKLMNRIAYAPQILNLPPIIRSLIPLLSLSSSVYGIALRFRHLLYRSHLLQQRRLAVPVISVGNLTWGGNGKTPMVEFLARNFADSGISPLILSRGYAGGDEVSMLRRQLAGTSAKIGVGANRGGVANALLNKFGVVDFGGGMCVNSPGMKTGEMCGFKSDGIGVAILDDGMQHLSLGRDLDIVMINAMMPWGNGCLIPRGPLREPLTALKRADIAILHHADLVTKQDLEKLESLMHEIKDDLPVFSSAMVPSHYFEVGNSSCNLPLKVLNNATVLCVSAIGSPTSFVQAIKKMGPWLIDRLDFSDHHVFQERVNFLEAHFHMYESLSCNFSQQSKLLGKLRFDVFETQDIDMILSKLKDMRRKSVSLPIAVITEKDYDRDPESFKMLDPYRVFVLCSRLQILPRKMNNTESFTNLVERLLSVDRSSVG